MKVQISTFGETILDCPTCSGTGYDPLDGGQCEDCSGTGNICENCDFDCNSGKDCPHLRGY